MNHGVPIVSYHGPGALFFLAGRMKLAHDALSFLGSQSTTMEDRQVAPHSDIL